MTQQKIPAHSELIKLWADGATIQYYNTTRDQIGLERGWQDCHNNLPTWTPHLKYRVKPEPKPDVVLYGCVERADWSKGDKTAKVFCCWADQKRIGSDSVMFVFDGETGKLKDVQILAHV